MGLVGVPYLTAVMNPREAPCLILELSECINETCPWSGKPVQADSLTEYGGQVVGFCNTGCRDKFEESAVRHFEAAKASMAAQ